MTAAAEPPTPAAEPCPNPLHDHPLPSGYIAALIAAETPGLFSWTAWRVTALREAIKIVLAGSVPVATPATCDHDQTEGHWVAGTNKFGYGSTSVWCTGPVPVATPPEPTRFVLVDWRPRGVGRMVDAAGVDIRLERQDDGRTLKVFLTGPVATPTEPEPLCEECCDGKHQRCPEQPGCCCARRLDAASPVPAEQPVDEVVCPSCGTRIRARMSDRSVRTGQEAEHG